jgi:putative ABC transport system permease protein
MVMIRFLFKGLMRDRARTLFPFLTVAIGVFLTVVMFGYIKGTESEIIRFNADMLTGHLKVMTRGYADEADRIPNDLALTGVEKLIRELKTTFPGTAWTPRIRFGGLLDVPGAQGETRAQGPVVGTAADILTPGSAELDRLGLSRSIARGRLPARTGEILIGEVLADRLGIGPGETATLIGSTMNGAMTTANYTVAGTVRFGIQALDRMGLIMDLADARAALDMDDAAGELLGFRTDGPYDRAYLDGMARRFNGTIAASADEFTPVMRTLRDQSQLAVMLDQMGSVNGIVIAVFLLAMSLVLWNAGLIGSLRRYGEIGVRLAMGETKGHVYRTLLGEAVLIGTLGTIAGTAAGMAVTYYLQAKGIDISGFFKNAAVMIPSVIRSKVAPFGFVIGFIPGILSTIIGTAIAGRGVYKRQTAQLFKELET